MLIIKLIVEAFRPLMCMVLYRVVFCLVAGRYVRAPQSAEENDLFTDLAEQLAEEKEMRAHLANELELSRKEVEELRAGLHAKDTGSNVDSQNPEFDVQAGFSSTHRIPSHPVASRSFEESRFLSSMNQLSVASINVPECKAANDEQIHRHTFELWKDLLVDSMKLAGIEEESVMYTIFKVKAGPRLLEIFRNTKSDADAPDAVLEPFSNAMHRLKTYFGSGSDVMLMRRRLTMMIQKDEESDLNFILRVGSTARLCEYDQNKEFDEIISTVAEHATRRDVRTAALKMLNRKCNFTDLVDKVRELEAIRLNEEYVMLKRGKQSDKTSAALVAPLRLTTNWEATRFTRGNVNNRGYSGRRANWRPSRGRQSFTEGRVQPKTFHQNGERCWRCYSVYHSADACRVKSKTCNRCGIVGHIQRACTNTNFKRSAEEALETVPAKIAAVEKVEEITAMEDMVSAVTED